MFQLSRLTLFTLCLLILPVMLWFLTPTIATAGTTVGQINTITPSGEMPGFIGHTQTGCVSQITVTSTGNSGPGTLRQALTNICSGGTINFAANLAGQTITLTSAELAITKTVTITNPNAPHLKLSGNTDRRVFNIQAGAVVTFSQLSIIEGWSSNSNGGGIYNRGRLTINNSLVSENFSFFGGAGIFVDDGAVLTLTNTIIHSNYNDGGNGGGIFNMGTSTINQSAFVENNTTFGSAISNWGLMTINNSTFSGNYNGSVAWNEDGGMLTINNSTFSDNPTYAVENNGLIHLRNNIVANGSDFFEYCNNTGTIATNINNLIEDGTCNPLFSGDPNLGPLQENGGATPSHALRFPSLALDAGNNATCLSTDQRGFSRPNDGDGDGTITCDIGAVEMPARVLSDIQVRGNGLLISNGDTAPSPIDHTDFGSLLVRSGALTRTFIISNNGVEPLVLTELPLVTFTDSSPAFSLAISPTSTIAPGSSTSFQVRFAPDTVGLHTATLMIANNDLDSDPYSFTIQGTALCIPTITVTSKGDNGPGTLRQAIADICEHSTIDFAPGLAEQTINLTSGELLITKSLAITNPYASNLSVSGNNTYRVFHIDFDTVVTLEHFSIISGYHASEGGGGIFSKGTLTLNGMIFDSNSSAYGGALQNEGPVIVNNSNFKNNSSTGSGGALQNDWILTLNNSTLSNNSAFYYGGGISSWSNTLIVNNSTFSGNSAEEGAGIYASYGTHLYLYNSIIANSLSGGDCYQSSALHINLNTLVEDGSCNSALSGDPRLGPLVDNGGSTPTHALLPGSPAINAGDNGTCLAVDQRDIARPQQGQCDIGAFESRGFVLAISGGNNQTTSVGAPFSLPLELTLTSQSGNEPVDGGVVSFTAPSSGASTTFAPTTTAVISTGKVALDVTANLVAGGPYNVVANIRGGNSVDFSLTNITMATPTVTLASTLNPSTVGQVVTFTAIVSSHLGTPTGSVTFVIDGTPQAPVILAGGQATFATAALAVGSHTVSANYSGDSNFKPTTGSLAGGQVVNAAVLPVVQFSQAVYTATEGVNSTQNLVLTRSGNLNQSSQVKVSLAGGTATAGTDYSTLGFPKTITFGSGAVSQTVSISLINDTIVESTETISLTVSSLSNAVIGSRQEVVVRIEDNDEASFSSKVYLPLLIK